MISKISKKFSELVDNVQTARESSTTLNLAMMFICIVAASVMVGIFAAFPAQSVSILLALSVARVVYAAVTSN